MAYHHHSTKARGFVGGKIRKIKREGIRGKKVGQKQAVAIALSMARKKGLKVGRKMSVAIHRGRKV